MPMPKSVLTCGGSRTLNANTTNYVCFGTGRFRESTTETSRQTVIRTAGRISAMIARFSGNNINGLVTITLRKNAAPTGLQIVLPSNSGGGVWYSPSDQYADVVAGDKLSYEIAAAGSAGTISFGEISVLFEVLGSAIGTCVTELFAAGIGGTVGTASATRFTEIAGDMDLSGGTEIDKNIKIFAPSGGTITDLGAYVSSNARVSNTTVTLRQNSGNSALTVTFTSGQSLWQEDNSHSITVASGDLLNLAVTTGSGVGNIVFEVANMAFKTTNNTFPTISSLTAGNSVSGNVTTYTVGGELNFSTTENFRNVPNRIRTLVRGLYTYTFSNVITSGNVTVAARVGGANAALSVSIVGATGSGETSDTVNSVYESPLDSLTWQVAGPGTSGSINFRSFSMVGEWLPTIPPKAFGLIKGVGRTKALGSYESP